MDSYFGALDVLEDNADNLLALAELADYPIFGDLRVPLKGRFFLNEFDVVEKELSLQRLQVFFAQRNEIKIKEVCTSNFKLEVVLVSFMSR